LRVGGIDCIITDSDRIDQALSTYLNPKSDSSKYFSTDADDFLPFAQRSPV
jgi:hypothetical protein